ncbi:N-acetyltransferase GCN5 [Roseobacter cerasinus]|uniref:N-acetyltransferase GCN5 n=1 Tax=Roseobacter cerasinus TaxID=2602289 RepID=A0A640VTW3_9RHOB|nr:GNAT family N-acetyltransferase [Roseobacter cerasinus]GFE51469.1 N-acetyltransferase GCN5 [Roseobacter cerasinus]
MSEIIISPARTLDAGAVGHILSASNDTMPWLPRLHSAAEEIMYAGDMIEAGWVRVAKRNGKVVGFIARWEEEVHALYVLPDAQDTGVGTALLEDAKAQSGKLSLWSYQANSSATRFYGLRGFIETARTDGSDNDAGLPDIRFEWVKGAI